MIRTGLDAGDGGLRAVLAARPVVRRQILPFALGAALGLTFTGCASPGAKKTATPAVETPPAATQPSEIAPRASDTEVQLAFQQGSAALGAGRYSEAIPHLYDVLEHEPRHTVARYNLGVALQRVRQWQESVDVLTAEDVDEVTKRRLAAEVRVPEAADADYLHALGAAYQEMRRYDQALACYDAAIAADAAHLKSRYARALCLQWSGDLQAARDAWRDYLARDPESSWTESARKHLAEVESRLSTHGR